MLTPRSYLFSRYSSTIPTKPGEVRWEERSKGALRKHDGTVRNAQPEMCPATPDAVFFKPSTKTDPVVIPARNNHGQRHGEWKDARHNGRKQLRTSSSRPQDVHSPSSIPPAAAALLAITSIPPPKSRSSQPPGQRLTVEAILSHTETSESEKELNHYHSFGKGPMGLLLGPPAELLEEDGVNNDVSQGSFLSRTISSESIPSLEDDGSPEEKSLSLSSPMTPSSRGRKPTPTRRIQPLGVSAEGESLEHPLSEIDIDIDQLDFRVFTKSAESGRGETEFNMGVSLPPRKSAFKSNLTASLKALKHAAISISNIKPPMLSPADFLTRSIISIDPQVPFTDERMPPRLEDIPTPALRRYLNPTTSRPIGVRVPLAPASSTEKCTASIQMQTYRVSKSGKSTTPNVISRRTVPTASEEMFVGVGAGPLARQRDMRENSDFIRIAVMETLMRRNGKLDERMPGRARWALPPRKPSTQAYEIGEGGVPVRWIGISA